MDTVFDIAVHGNPPSSRAATDEAFAEVSRLEGAMSSFVAASAISRINDAGGRPVAVPAEIIDVIEEARAISELTNGAFDITFAGLGRLWDFKRTPPVLPDPAEIARRLPLIDYRRVAIDRAAGTVTLTEPGARIGLGGIGKGYAVDRAAAILEARGVNDFIVSGGGNLLVSGAKGKTPWTIGVRDPRGPDGSYLARVRLPGGGGVSTSGDYERFFEIDGRRYHHILDPRTGYPARGLVSATIFAPTAMRADGLSTGVFVLGPEKGMALVEALPDVEGVLIDEGLAIHVSSGLKGRVEILPR
jgi:FAD:protein FMN transferase